MPPVSPTFSDEFDDDHCVVHQFIRRHGRSPTPEEVIALRSSAVATGARATADDERSALTQVVRREVVRLIHRP
ncbi:hypothetical protein IEZ26_22620 [Nocardioides cavernae]|uniref:DUF3263 domain-containing protein n=1 Tax=Nocardioides cavernae TaxID=1921566 RepID=A0ABR8NKI2_9ACTN|nr:hypothetical protein [Nocardioides cavernae]MBD3927434.1 hypothetical protein [Nocardioides cavernae]MBM7512961.1 hypothetical protein [Nocardioides cavernae]